MIANIIIDAIITISTSIIITFIIMIGITIVIFYHCYYNIYTLSMLCCYVIRFLLFVSDKMNQINIKIYNVFNANIFFTPTFEPLNFA